MFLFALACAILLLRWQYPAHMGDSGRWLSIIYNSMSLLLIGSCGYVVRLDRSTMMKYTAIWLAIIIGLMLFYDLMR